MWEGFDIVFLDCVQIFVLMCVCVCIYICIGTYVYVYADAYKPVCYRLGVDGNYYPVNPVNPDGTVNMIQVINPTTDKVPMIYRVDDNGYLTPELE